LVPRMTALERLVADRAARLTLYQDAAYAARYRALVERVRAAEQSATPGRTGLASAAARAYFKLLAYKDEYEVARLFADGDFLERVRAQFDGKLKLSFYLAPPLFSRRDPDTGLPRKRRFGAWVLHAFRLLSRMKRLRGTAFDPFGWMAERRLERRLIAEYEALIDELLPELTADKHHLAVALASLPERIKGFGHVKERNLEAAEQDKARLLDQFRSGHPKLASAA
jgi:indolepyruvate ferredoxin oxidoreductase